MAEMLLTPALEELCRNVGAFQMQHLRGVKMEAISDKGLNQLVSFVDVESEKMLVEGLRKINPDADFITEEGTQAEAGECISYWIIDPLDGTTNYLHGLQVFSISVALMQENSLMAGIVHCPAMGETFTAEKDKGAFLNGVPISVSGTDNLKQSLIATGFPYYQFQHTEAYLKLLGNLMRDTQGLRRMGSAAIDLAYTACGRFDGFYELGLSSWDVAAGALIVQEAGGLVSDFSEGTDYLFGKTIVAGNPQIKEQLLQCISASFGEMLHI
jgi:myo-inositol-1(or 4)-monophosphatase